MYYVRVLGTGSSLLISSNTLPSGKDEEQLQGYILHLLIQFKRNKSRGLVTSALTAITVGCIKHCVVGDCFQTQSTVSFVISWNYRECLSFLAPM